MNTITRRTFLKGLSVSSTGVILSFSLTGCDDTSSVEMFEAGAWLSVFEDGSVQLQLSKTEMGQQIKTSLAALVANELECDVSQIQIKLADLDPKYGSQATAGSSSIVELFKPIRVAAATLASAFKQAAGQVIAVPVNELSLDSGRVVHANSGKNLPFASLFTLLKLSEQEPSLKPLPKNMGYASVDGKAICDGSLTYGIDFSLPAMKFAAIRQAPLGHHLKQVVKGEQAKLGLWLETEQWVAVVANSYWQAEKLLDEATIEWTTNSSSLIEQAEIIQQYQQALLEPGKTVYEKGTVPNLSSNKLEAEYFVGYQAHVAMEPISCTVSINDSGCDLWVATQDPYGAVEAARSVLNQGFEKLKNSIGLGIDIRLHQQPLGGSFGRRLQNEFVVQAVTIAQEFQLPVKLIWSRSQDLQHDHYRPLSLHKLQAHFDSDNQLSFWQHQMVGPSNGRTAGGSSNLPYQIPAIKIDIRVKPTGVSIGSWRAIGNGHNAFITESFWDEIAHKIGVAPIDFRLQAMDQHPRAKAVLELAIAKANQSSEQIEDQYMGAAVHTGFGSYCAAVAKIRKLQHGIKIEKIYCAVDCGQVVNSDAVKAQIEGGLLFGLSSALKGQVTFKQSKVEQSNFHDYPPLTITDSPDIEVVLVDSDEAPGGVGEVGVPPAAPAVANAVFLATGIRLRSLPFEPKVKFV